MELSEIRPGEVWRFKVICVLLLVPLFSAPYYVLVCDVHQSILIKSVSQWVVWPLFLSLPLLSPSPLSFSSCVCACSSQCVRRCCGSSRGSSCVVTACRWGADGQRQWCGHGRYPWRSVGHGLPRSASATASCAGARDYQNPCLTDWPRRQPWLQGGAATYAFAPSADASRDLGCVLQEPLGLSLHPHTVTRA